MEKKISKTGKKRKIKSTHPTKTTHRMKNGVPDLRRINVQNRIRSTMTGTRNIDDAVHKTNAWLKELMESMHWDNRERALSAYRATIHALRDILPIHDAVKFGAQLPLILKGVYFDGWKPKDFPARRINTPADFYELVREELGAAALKFSNAMIQEFTQSVFQSLVRHIGGGEFRKLKGLLREPVRDIIPSPAAS